jgi:predicted aldo/keto reductase-like oxidoreductase
MNVKGTEAEITAICAKLGIGLSVIEPLKSGGVRLVVNTAAEVERLEEKLGKSLILGPVERSARYVSRQQISYF